MAVVVVVARDPFQLPLELSLAPSTKRSIGTGLTECPPPFLTLFSDDTCEADPPVPVGGAVAMNGADVQRNVPEEDEVSEDSTALLPRHTKVLVTGNNRTKSKLVGLEGVVKKAVGLGGWHWLVLSDGSNVRLQRNALTVLEQPTGEESESEEDDVTTTTTGARGGAGEGRTTFAASSVVGGRTKRKPSRYATTTSLRSRQDDSPQELAVNFNKLHAETLRRYKRHFKLTLHNNPTKADLVSAVGAHFMKQKVDERKVLHTFVESISKRVKTK